MRKSTKPLKIKIGGNLIAIQTQVGELRVKQIESFINKKYNEVKLKNPGLTYTEYLILTLLYLTDELMDAKERFKTLYNSAIEEIRMIRESALEIGEFIENKISGLDDEAG